MSKPSKVNGTTIAFVEGRKKYSLFNRSVSAVMFVSSTDAPHASEPFDLLNERYQRSRQFKCFLAAAITVITVVKCATVVIEYVSIFCIVHFLLF